MDKTKPNRVAGAVGFNVRSGDFYVFRSKAVIVSAGGASHIFKPRAVGEGMGRTWYAPWSSAFAYALPILAGAKMMQMENRIVLRFGVLPPKHGSSECGRMSPRRSARKGFSRDGLFVFSIMK
jgi:succinate dehydrogenase/fumarate reductase flavoprotein subunit